jgi:plastocyanin
MRERQVSTMRKLILALAAVAALAVAGPAGAATKTINIYGSAFSPKSATITEGDTVTWVNRDNANHQILADKGQFVSPILKPKQTWSFTFRAAGTYNYHDELYPKIKGTITVKGLPPTLTLAASAPIVVYGTQVTLTGVVSDHQPGESVTIYYQPYPQPNPIQRAVVLTTTGGAFSFIVEPQVLTSYEAAWKNAYATPTTVEVQPKLTLGRNNGWIIHAAAGRSFAGRAVQFQRLNTATGQWVTLKKVLLNSHSSARVLYPLPKGTHRLRVTMSVNQAGAGFLGAISPTVTWHQLT